MLSKEIQLEVKNDYLNFSDRDVELELVEEWYTGTLKYVDDGKSFRAFAKTKSIKENKDNMDEKEELIIYQPLDILDLHKSLKNVECRIINPKYDYNFHQKHNNDKKKELDNMHPNDKIKMQKYLYTKLATDSKNETNIGFVNDYENHRKVKRIDETEEEFNKNNKYPISLYNAVKYYPHLKGKERNLHGALNVFTGYPLENVELKEVISFEKSLLYKHLKYDFCNGNRKEFRHFMVHIADMLQDGARVKPSPHNIRGNGGTGKSMMIKFMKKLLGSNNVAVIDNPEFYFKNFNINMMHKQLRIFEENESEGTAHKNRCIIKADTAKEEERIEPKGVDPFETNHVSRYWFFSNHENSNHIEAKDRRFTCHYISCKHENDEEYFNKLFEEINSEQFCRNAFEYFANLDYKDGEARRCYNNKFKIEQQLLNVGNAVKFIKEVIETNFEGILYDITTKSIRASVLNDKYRKWTDDKQKKRGDFTKQLEVKLDLKTTQINKQRCYVIEENDMKERFNKMLGVEDFHFNKDKNITQGGDLTNLLPTQNEEDDDNVPLYGEGDLDVGIISI